METDTIQKGVIDGQDVFFGPLTKTPGGLANSKDKTDQIPSRETVWITNVKGVDMTTCVGLETAKYFINRAGNKFRYATQEEIPMIPEQKIYPYDPEKKIHAQEKANVEMTGLDVKNLVDQGVDPLEGTVSYKEMRAIAKENDINTFKMKKKELGKILKEKGLIK